MKQTAHYFLIGGFPGPGVTSALADLAGHLKQNGMYADLITSDQSGAFLQTTFTVDHMKYFRPASPQPTHRLERLEKEVSAV